MWAQFILPAETPVMKPISTDEDDRIAACHPELPDRAEFLPIGPTNLGRQHQALGGIHTLLDHHAIFRIFNCLYLGARQGQLLSLDIKE